MDEQKRRTFSKPSYTLRYKKLHDQLFPFLRPTQLVPSNLLIPMNRIAPKKLTFFMWFWPCIVVSMWK